MARTKKTKARRFKGKEPSKRNKDTKECSGRLLSFCGTCMDKKTKAEMPMMSNNSSGSYCSHSYCKVCISNHVAAKISQNILKVNCPELGCYSFLEPQNCGSFIPQQVLDGWEAALCETIIGSEKIYCPYKDFSATLVDDGTEVVTSAECPHCYRLFCARCQGQWHAGSECESSEGSHDNMDKQFIDLAQREHWQKYTNRGFFAQKIDGCA
ncbi:E3 ubiquitin ligase RBR family [Parasponia andersonii]|uniref:RBR-type E3 ubiquitin transferase n=1 Tax=Parasponia andersonii TaxID=3476 RepID=A0A2P5CQ15_PARAD|nr:E3 ubiquitin ligase RBR family [Parasponia andersonii]